MLLATAERRLGGEYEKRAAALVADADESFTLRTEAGRPVALLWRGHEVAKLGPGKNLLSPRILLDRRIERVSDKGREAVILRLKDWLRAGAEAALGPLRAAGHAAQDKAAPAAVRALLALLVDEGGIVARDAVAGPLAALDKEQRRAVTRLGIRIGALDLYMPALLKPEAMRWRAALRAAASGADMPLLPPQSSVVLATPPDRALLGRLGFRAAGPQMIRVDMAERIAARAHEARAGEAGDAIDPALITSLGLLPETVAKLMRDIGFRPNEAASGWIWRGRERRRRPRPAETPGSSHFAALAELKRG
jgi:ATP-dependent RNA helicase SUPV3L1/SUV3